MSRIQLSNSDKTEGSFVMTKEDLEQLNHEIAESTEFDSSLDTPELYFKFQNHPEMSIIPTLEAAIRLASHAKRFWEDNPDGKYWVSYTRDKEH